MVLDGRRYKIPPVIRRSSPSQNDEHLFMPPLEVFLMAVFSFDAPSINSATCKASLTLTYIP
jgi:hypothetical protein